MKQSSIFCALLVCALPLTLLPQPIEARELHKDVSQVNKPATIKVLVTRNQPDVLLEVTGRYHIYDPVDSVLIDKGILGKRAPIFSGEENIKWAEIMPIGLRQFRIVPGDSQCKILINGIQYLGCVEAYEENGKITVINEIDVENYLKATLAPLFATEKNQELLEAIAIVARTNTYYTIAHGNSLPWQAEADHVGYSGLGLSSQNLRLDHAIDNTKYMVMTHNQTPFVALWTKDSAGKTADTASILRKETNSPHGVTIPLAQRDREKRKWSLTITKEQVAQIAGVNQINALELFLDKESDKVYALRIHDGFKTKDLDFFTLQKAIGAKKLRSNDFTVEVKKENILISGFGEGHGIGLCLYSARMMAERGDRATKILSTFFPDTQLEKKREIL